MINLTDWRASGGLNAISELTKNLTLKIGTLFTPTCTHARTLQQLQYLYASNRYRTADSPIDLLIDYQMLNKGRHRRMT